MLRFQTKSASLAVSGMCCLASPLLPVLPMFFAILLLLVWGLSVIPGVCCLRVNFLQDVLGMGKRQRERREELCNQVSYSVNTRIDDSDVCCLRVSVLQGVLGTEEKQGEIRGELC